MSRSSKRCSATSTEMHTDSRRSAHVLRFRTTLTITKSVVGAVPTATSHVVAVCQTIQEVLNVLEGGMTELKGGAESLLLYQASLRAKRLPLRLKGLLEVLASAAGVKAELLTPEQIASVLNEQKLTLRICPVLLKESEAD